MSYRILYINTRFAGYGASGEQLETIRGLERKYDMGLIVGRDDINFDKLRELSGTKVTQVKWLVRDIHPLKDIIALLSLYKHIRTGNYHIVHTATAKAGMLGRIAAKLAGTPIIVHGLLGTTFHSSQNALLRSLFVLLERSAAKFTDCFLCVGDDLKRKYIKQNIGREQDYVIRHTGMNLEEFFRCGNVPAGKIMEKRQELGLQGDDIVIGKVSGLEPRKGHLYCIEAAERVVSRYPKVKFLFAGKGWYRPKLESEVEKRHLGKNVIFAGFREDIAEVMATFDIMVHTSLWEGLPQVFVQACAVGKPIVTFEVEGAHDMITEGENGFIVPIKDVDALVEKLGLLVSNLDKAKEMGLEGRKKVDDSWKIESMIRDTDQLYQELLDRKYRNNDKYSVPRLGQNLLS